MHVNDGHGHMSVDERKEKVEAALARLKSLKRRIYVLRVQCEAFRLESEEEAGFTCEECGKLIEEGEEVTLKDSFGKLVGCYHKDCFKAVWLSQNWKFDVSSLGFLRLSGSDQ